MKSCDKKLRNKKNLMLFLVGSAMLLLASCSSAPAVLNGNQFLAQNEVANKVVPSFRIIENSTYFDFFFPTGEYFSSNDVDGVLIDEDADVNSYTCYAGSDIGLLLEEVGTSITIEDFTYNLSGNTFQVILGSGVSLTSYDYYVFRLNLNWNDDTVDVFLVYSSSVIDSDVFERAYDDQLDYVYNLNVSVPPLGVTFVQDIVDILVSGITNLGSALGQGISTTAQAMFINASNDGLSVWGILVASFAGLALAVGLTRLVFGFITSLGGKN